MPHPVLRRGSVAAILLRIAFASAVILAGWLFWQKTMRDRALAEEAEARTDAALRAQTEAESTKPKQEVADIEYGPKPEKPAPKPAEDVGTNQLVKENFGPRRTSNFIPDANYADFDYGTPPKLDTTPEGRQVLATIEAAGYKFTPVVKEAYLKYVQDRVLKDLRALKKTAVPDEFLSWTRNDPIVAATVYGSRAQPAKVVLLLWSLEQDLGKKTVREDYKQLALGSAVIWAGLGWDADLELRKPIVSTVPGDPRKPVDTKSKDRPLDMNDHIVNFLKDHPPIMGDVVGGMTEMLDELKYDAKGVGKITTRKSAAKIRRPVIPADIFASAALQKEFNDYMKSKGFDISIDCGDHVIFPGQTEAIESPHRGQIKKAFDLFRTAMEEKGLLAKREPEPSLAEVCAYLIANNERIRNALVKWKRPDWVFPLKSAPWPVMELLINAHHGEIRTPLREREEIVRRFIAKGETHTYGEYIGPIAQQYDMQSARRLCPFDFSYGSFQMMLKDGGVCGTMAGMAVATHRALGSPASRGGQPGHCALMLMRFDQKTRKFRLDGHQFVTGDESQTGCHTPWNFGDVDGIRGMPYHMSLAYACNAGLDKYLDSQIAYNVCRALPDAEKKKNGVTLLSDAIRISPFNLNLAETAWQIGDTREKQLGFFQAFEKAFKEQATRAACPHDSHFVNLVRTGTVRAAMALPPTENAAVTDAIEDIRRKIPPPPKPKE